MESDNAIFQDLESLGKEKFSKTAMEKFRFLFGKTLKYLEWIQLSVVLNTVYVMLVHVPIYDIIHNAPKNLKLLCMVNSFIRL